MGLILAGACAAGTTTSAAADASAGVLRKHAVSAQNAHSADRGTAASKITTLGQQRFPEVFAGVTLRSPQVITIYLRSGHRSNEFIRRADDIARNTSIVVKYVRRSFSQLNALTHRIARDWHALRAEGLNLQSWGPDPSSGTVLVSLSTPTSQDLAAVRREAHLSVEQRSTYPRAATLSLHKRYGDAVQVATVSSPPLRSAGRFHDSPPYFGADRIWVSEFGASCTSGFAVRGSAGGTI